MIKNVKIITLGCSKNLVDSEHIMRQLELNGATIVSEEDNSPFIDLVAINTCGFIHDAKEESIETIFEEIAKKNDGNIGKIIVFGCLSERYRTELKSEIPEVDFFLGKFAFEEILNVLNLKLDADKTHERVITTPLHYAYLKISEGCNRKCAFCAIPLITGKHKSVSIDQLEKEARYLASKGAKELILIAQDLNQFGIDKRPRASLFELLDRLSAIDTIEWIRLQYLYPKGFPSKLPQYIANNPKICHYIDIPFQHASNKLLALMGRGHTNENNLAIIKKLRKAIPNIAIRTTMIVGFPGETTKDFEELLHFVEEAKFDRLGAFMYSHEENTPAAINYKDTVSKSLKEKRLNQLMELQERISFEINVAKIGSVQKVLIDRIEGDFYIGRTQYDSPEVDNEVIINNSKKIDIGTFQNIKITDTQAFDLTGEFE